VTSLTIAHALTMTLGTAWPESGIPYSDPSNRETAMEAAVDRYRFILERPIVAEPGTKWIYNGGATALLGRLIAKGTGKSLQEYARSALFAPLDLARHNGPPVVMESQGPRRALAWYRVTSRASASWFWRMEHGWVAQVVPPSWLEASFRPAVTIDE
jgi:CubicO group peptidase (beta-lactamase class C family)